MSHLIYKFLEEGIIKKGEVPNHFPTSIQYLTITGSFAYGVSKSTSDKDVLGFCIPRKEEMFPHLRGEIPGFGTQKQNFEQWQLHHLKRGEEEYDFTVYSIIKYFDLCMDNNPNMVDTLFTPLDCVIHMTTIGALVRDNRKLFLSKKSYHKFRGYAYSQLHKISIKTDPKNENRKKDVEQYGLDLKFAYHTVRLALEAEMILKEQDLDLRRNSSLLASIRGGEYTKDQIVKLFEDKERELQDLYIESQLPEKPREPEIKELLLNCLEEYFGSLKEVIPIASREKDLVQEIKALFSKYDL